MRWPWQKAPAPSVPAVAGTVKITQTGLFVDGHPFPWHIDNRVNVKLSDTDIPVVVIRLFCDNVQTEGFGIGGKP